MLTNYRIVYQLSNRVKEIRILAATPMQALKKFKEMMPTIIYKNLALKEVDEVITPEIKDTKKCFACEFKIA